MKYHQPSAAFVDIFYTGTWKCRWFIILLAFYLSLSHFNTVLNKCCRATKCPQVDNYRASIKNYCAWIAPIYSDLEMLFTECKELGSAETKAAREGDLCFPFLYFNGEPLPKHCLGNKQSCLLQTEEAACLADISSRIPWFPSVQPGLALYVP